MIGGCINKYNKRFGPNVALSTRFFYSSSYICFIGFLANIILSLALKLPFAGTYIYILACFFVVFINLLVDNARTEKDQQDIILAFCVGINLFFLPTLYLTAGGIHSAVPLYFIIGIVISILLLNGKRLAVVLTIEIIVYCAIFILSYLKPQTVTHFIVIGDERFYIVALGCVLTGFAIGSILRVMTIRFEAERKKASCLVTKLEDLTTHDMLTGAYNRRFLISYIEDCIKRIDSKELSSFSIIIYDLDRFKSINDTYGHLTGDEVLKSFSNVLRSNMRSSDIVARYGGEEFIIVMPTANDVAAFRRAEQIRSKVEATSLSDDIKGRVTVSGGIAEYDGFVTVEQLIETADKNLYLAKEQGRNKIVWRNGEESPV